MRRQIPFLRGVAILAVVANHTTGTGLGALFFWAHSYRDGNPPYLGEYGTLTYYSLSTIGQLALFSVPAFLFISGYFIAYAARGERATLSWKIVRTRVSSLLWPYLIWSVVAYAWQLFQGALLKGSEGYSLGEFLMRLVTGSVMDAYFFVPLLIQFYLLAPVIVRLAKQRSGLVLAVALALQLSVGTIWYLHMSGVVLSRGLQVVLEWGILLFVHWALFFPLGTICGFNAGRIGQWLSRHKRLLLSVAILLGVLSVLETLALHHLQTDILGRSQEAWLKGYVWKFSTIAYSVAAILAILSLSRRVNWFTTLVERIGSKSYGIYLVHPIVIQVVATFLRFVAPWLGSQQWLLQPIVFVAAVGLPMLLMELVSRSPVKKLYRYAFS